MAEAETMKEGVMESEDLISSLPDAILGAIVSLLPGDEGVRTCILSQRWKTVWKYASNLNINLTQILKCMKQAHSHHKRHMVDRYRDNEELNIDEEEERLMNSVLDSHFCSLESCSIKFSSNDCFRGNAVWFKNLLEEKKVKRLSIEKYNKRSNHWSGVSILDCPFEIFFSKLEALELKNCYLRTEPLNVCAWLLRTLTFKQVCVYKDSLHEILSNCLSLENLTLDNCKYFEGVKIDSPSLRFVRVCRIVMIDIVVSTVNLEILEMDNIDCETQSLTIEAPKLHVLRSSGDSKNGVQNFCWVRRILQQANILHNHDGNQILQGSITNFTSIFENVTTIGIDLDLKRVKNVVALFSAIRLCPKLENLEINCQVNGDEIQYHSIGNIDEDYLPYPNILFSANREIHKCMDHQLKTLTIKGFVGEEQEVEFLKYIITTAEVLKNIRIWFVDDCLWAQAIHTRSLLSFSKISPKLTIRLYPGPIYMANVGENFETWLSTLTNY